MKNRILFFVLSLFFMLSSPTVFAAPQGGITQIVVVQGKGINTGVVQGKSFSFSFNIPSECFDDKGQLVAPMQISIEAADGTSIANVEMKGQTAQLSELDKGDYVFTFSVGKFTQVVQCSF